MASLPRRSIFIAALATLALTAFGGGPNLRAQDALTRASYAVRPGQHLVALGEKLFFEARLSATGKTACASCHDPARAFSDPRRVSISDSGTPGTRNALAVVNATVQPTLMWDGRFGSIEEQALSPFDRGEMGTSAETAVWRLNWDPQYVYLFRLALGRRPSAEGMAKALAAYERTLAAGESRFDRFLTGDATALSPLERTGFAVFSGKGRCATCHLLAPLSRGRARVPLTDFRFHNLGVGFEAGRFADLVRYQITGVKEDVGAFRTPSLRSVALTAPYMHDGSLATLEDVVEFYDRGGRPNPNLSPVIRRLFLSPQEKRGLVAFLRSLTDTRYEDQGQHDILDRIGVTE